MQRIVVVALLIALACLTGCVQSVHPIYTKKDVVFEPALVGLWSHRRGTDWSFTRSDEKSYRLVSTSKKGESQRFVAYLAKIDGMLFLDFSPDYPKNEFYLPIHTWCRVELTESTLSLHFLNHKWLTELIAENPDAIGHAKINDQRFLLTAPTREFQAFVVKHAKTREAFNRMKLTKKGPREA